MEIKDINPRKSSTINSKLLLNVLRICLGATATVLQNILNEFLKTSIFLYNLKLIDITSVFQ